MLIKRNYKQNVQKRKEMSNCVKDTAIVQELNNIGGRVFPEELS